MKNIAILGSTGSIGRSTLEVARSFRKDFSVVGLSANSNIALLYRQIREFHPEFVCVRDQRAARKLKAKLNFNHTRLFSAEDSLLRAGESDNVDLVVMAIAGSSALLPLLSAIDNRKTIALANKEALVMAGSIIMRKAKKNNVKIIPIDSEQSAIWQCLAGQDKSRLKNVYLTASGGPFVNRDKKDLEDISVEQVLKHPRWKMGKKVTVDSATLMNKGLEVMEAMHLFGVPLEKIKVLVHPESIIHSMVEFIDGTVLAQLSVTDMRIPIQYALSYPQRLPNNLAGIDFLKIKRLNFQEPDLKKFPCLGLAFAAAALGGTMPVVLNAANEASVDEFLNKKLKFSLIPYVVGKVLDKHKNNRNPGLEEILEADAWARVQAYSLIESLR